MDRVRHKPNARLTAAQQQLVVAHAWLVHTAVWRLAKGKRQATSYVDDLVQTGWLALCTAARLFDTTRGVKFGTFAWYHVRQALWQGLRHMANPVHVPAGAAQGQWAGRGGLPRGVGGPDQGDTVIDYVTVDKALGENTSARDKAIWWARRAGDEYPTIGAKHGVSKQRAQQIADAVQCKVDIRLPALLAGGTVGTC